MIVEPSPFPRGTARTRLHSTVACHSFEQCTNLFLPSLDWAFDINDQTTDRVHRLTSTQPVHIYTCITDNTVDERLYSLYCEKGDSSHLALDGRLFEERTEEVNLAQLLRDAVRDFNPHASTIEDALIHFNELWGDRCYLEMTWKWTLDKCLTTSLFGAEE